MALIHAKMDKVSRNPLKIDDQALEFVFGKPDSSKPDNLEMINAEKNHSNHKDSTGETYNSSLPLLEPEMNKEKPPLAGPEIDDLDGTTPTIGVFDGTDDGLLDVNDDKTHILDMDGTDLDENKTKPETGEDGIGTDDDNDLELRFGYEPPPPSVDVNVYQQKKSLAQGMMDLALLSANANQLRYVLESTNSHPYFYPSIVLISLSIIFQIAVGVGLIVNSKYDFNDDKEKHKADKINNFTVLGIFLITIVNVFITSFSVATPTVLVTATPIQQAGSG